MLESRPTKIKIKLKNFKHNVNTVKRLLSPSVSMLAVVKANAYGHGSVEIAKVLEKNNVEFLGVACGYEAMNLFKHNIKTRILSLGKIYREDIEIAEKYPYSLTVTSVEDLKELANSGKTFNVHLKFDTGMGRCGVFSEKAKFFIDFLNGNKNIIVEGVLTHFPAADNNVEFTNSQIDNFKEIKEIFSQNGYNDIFWHCANSDGILNFEHSHFNLVRPGLVLYGSYHNKKVKEKLGLKPVMEFISKVVDIKEFEKGWSIGYGRTYKVEKDRIKAALIPVGYADGYSRALSNRGKVLIDGNLCNVIGRVSMDWIVADITGSDVSIGSNVTLFGDDSLILDVDDLAVTLNTISYEILCNVGKNYRKEIIFDINN